MATPKTDWKAETLELASILEDLVAHPERQLSVLCAKRQVEPKRIWAWLQQFNAGKKDLSTTRYKAALCQLKIDGAPEARPAAPAPAAAAPADSARNDKSQRLWLKADRGPRRASMEEYRGQLETLAKGGEAPRDDVAFVMFLRKWFGTARPAREDAAAFLEWWSQKTKPAPLVEAPEKPRRAPKARRPAKPAREARENAPAAPAEQKSADSVRLPVGLRPRYIVEQQRMHEVAEACLRYIRAGLQVPAAWIEELATAVDTEARRLFEIVAGGGREA